jgi:hypothetical protein
MLCSAHLAGQAIGVESVLAREEVKVARDRWQVAERALLVARDVRMPEHNVS